MVYHKKQVIWLGERREGEFHRGCAGGMIEDNSILWMTATIIVDSLGELGAEIFLFS